MQNNNLNINTLDSIQGGGKNKLEWKNQLY